MNDDEVDSDANESENLNNENIGITGSLYINNKGLWEMTWDTVRGMQYTVYWEPRARNTTVHTHTHTHTQQLTS